MPDRCSLPATGRRDDDTSSRLDKWNRVTITLRRKDGQWAVNALFSEILEVGYLIIYGAGRFENRPRVIEIGTGTGNQV